jgi:hypothetical protein
MPLQLDHRKIAGDVEASVDLKSTPPSRRGRHNVGAGLDLGGWPFSVGEQP